MICHVLGQVIISVFLFSSFTMVEKYMLTKYIYPFLKSSLILMHSFLRTFLKAIFFISATNFWSFGKNIPTVQISTILLQVEKDAVKIPVSQLFQHPGLWSVRQWQFVTFGDLTQHNYLQQITSFYSNT